MRRRLALGVTIMLIPTSASAARTQGLSFSVPTPKAGATVVYDIKISVALPPTVTLGPGMGPTLHASTMRAPKGVLASAAIKAAGKGEWIVAVVARRNKGTSGGAAKIAGSFDLTGPLAGLPATESPPTVDKNCSRFNVESGAALVVYALLGSGADSEIYKRLSDSANCH